MVTMLQLFKSVIATLAIWLLTAASLQAAAIAVIGTGDVGGTLGPRLAELGHTVVYGSRTPQAERVRELVQRTPGQASAASQSAAAAAADIVILAVPASVAVKVTEGLGDLDGKVVIDPTNPFRFTDDRLAVRTIGDSMTQRIQAAAPGARVVKAFNTLSYQTMADPVIAGGPVTIPLAGDDTGAKEEVAELVRALGLEAVDVGPARYAREIEGMLILWMNARLNGRGFDYHLRPTPDGGL
jgi:NADPH-dependent F420 reductase